MGRQGADRGGGAGIVGAISRNHKSDPRLNNGCGKEGEQERRGTKEQGGIGGHRSKGAKEKAEGRGKGKGAAAGA